MTALRIRLRDGAVVWRQITRCEPELEVIVAVAGEVERWGDGLPLVTRALATAHAADQAFTLIAVPGIGSAWVASSALQPGDADGDVVLVEPTSAYATRSWCEWRAATAPAHDGRHGDWVEVDRGARADWVFVRRLRHGQPAGPLSRIAPDDVVERWHADRDDVVDATAQAAEDGRPPPDSPEPAAPTSIETLLRFLRLGAPDGDAALDVVAVPYAASADATTGSDDAALADRTALPWLEDAMSPTDVQSAAGEISNAGLARDAVDAPSSTPAPIATSAAPTAKAAQAAGPSAPDAPPSQPHGARPAVPGASPALPSSSGEVAPTPSAARSASASGSSTAPAAPSASSGRTPSSSAAAPVPSALPAQPAPSHDTRLVPSAPRAQVPASNDASRPPGALPAHTPTSSAAAPASRSPAAWHAPSGSAPTAQSPASSPALPAGVPQVRISSSGPGAQDTSHGSAHASSAAPASSRAPHASAGPSQPAPATPRPTADATRPPAPGQPPTSAPTPPATESTTPPRGRIATARRGADDLGLPAHPAPAPDVEATPTAHPRSVERSRADRPSGPTALAPTAAPAAPVLPPRLAVAPSPHAPVTAPSHPQPVAVRRPQGDVPPTPASAPIAHASSTATATVTSSPPATAATASPTPSTTSATAPAAHVAPEQTRAPVVVSAAAPRTTPATPAADPRPRAASLPPHDVPTVEGTSVAAVAHALEAPVTPRPRTAGDVVNREIHIGDVVVELGEPLPPRRTIERAGSLLASLPRPSLRPRRRL